MQPTAKHATQVPLNMSYCHNDKDNNVLIPEASLEEETIMPPAAFVV